MAEFGNNLKNIWMKGMEAIGNRRAEILKDFGAKA